MLTFIFALSLHAHAKLCAEAIGNEPPPPTTNSLRDYARMNKDYQKGLARFQARIGREPGVYHFAVPREIRIAKLIGALEPTDRSDPFYVVTDPALVNAALRTPQLIDRTYMYSPAMRTKIGARSILMLPDAESEARQDWKTTHNVMMPFFTPRYVQTEYAEQVREQARITAALLRDGEPVNRALEEFVLANVLKPLFGQAKVPEITDRFSKELRELFWDAPEAEHAASRRRLEKFVAPAVKRARANPGHDLIDRLIAMNQPDEFLYDQLISVYFAGQLTTKVMLGMALHFLTEHPEWQARLRDEYRAYRDGRLTLDEMQSSEHFLNETLRVYPPVPIINRYTTADTRLGEYLIPRGAYVHLNVYATLHDPRVWGDDHAAFRPERWEGRQVRNGDFCPFGWGPRICIGQHLAMLEGKLLLGEILDRYRLEAAAPFAPPDDWMGNGLVHLNALELRFL